MTDDLTRVAALALRRRDAGEAFAVGAAELGRLADELGALDAEYNAAAGAAGITDNGPPARELAAEIALGRLGALRPHLPYTTAAAADRAAEALSRLGSRVVA